MGHTLTTGCLFLAGFFLQVPGLLSVTAVAAVMQTQSATSAGLRVAVLSQLPMVTYVMQVYHSTWPLLSRMLCGELTPAEQAAMSLTGAAMQQQQQQSKQTSPAVCAAATRVLLGSSTILLQQLLRMAAAGAAAAAAAAAATETHQRQQQQLRAAILYCADAVGGLGQALWLDLRLDEADVPVDDCLLLHSSQNTSTLARAVQAFEAAVRHLAAAVPPTAAGSTVAVTHTAAGSMVVAGSSSSSSSSSKPVLPPTIAPVEQLALGIYCSLVNYATGVSSIRHLSCPQQQLLQAVLSLLLTSSKLWQAGLRPPVPLEALQCLTGEAFLYVKFFLGGGVARGPSASASAVRTVGGVQVCQLVSRYLGCVEQQLRQLVASGDPVGAAKWLLGSSAHSCTPVPCERPSCAAAAAAGNPPTCLQALNSVVVAVGALVPVDSVGAEAVQCWQQLFTNLGEITEKSAESVLQPHLAGVCSEMLMPHVHPEVIQKVMQTTVLNSLPRWADQLGSIGSALAASVPSRFGCNWPGCVRLSGVSEGYGLVRGQACVCGSCRQAR
jgi:hypothetical protein